MILEINFCVYYVFKEVKDVKFVIFFKEVIFKSSVINCDVFFGKRIVVIILEDFFLNSVEYFVFSKGFMFVFMVNNIDEY